MSDNIKYTNISTFERTVPGSYGVLRDHEPFITANGDLLELRNIDSIVRGITKILSINEGSYFYNPTFGAALYKHIFELGDDVSRQIIDREVYNQLKDYAPGIITEISSTFINNDNIKGFRITINIKYQGDERSFNVPITDQLLK